MEQEHHFVNRLIHSKLQPFQNCFCLLTFSNVSKALVASLLKVLGASISNKKT